MYIVPTLRPKIYTAYSAEFLTLRIPQRFPQRCPSNNECVDLYRSSYKRRTYYAAFFITSAFDRQNTSRIAFSSAYENTAYCIRLYSDITRHVFNSTENAAEYVAFETRGIRRIYCFGLSLLLRKRHTRIICCLCLTHL